MGETGLLYYPWVRPPRVWLGRALLYGQMVGSIVPPEGLKPWPELRRLGLFEYHRPGELLSHDHDVFGLADEVQRELAKGTAIDPTSDSSALLIEGKLPYDLTAELIRRGLLESTRGGFSGTSPQVVPVLLAIVATRVASVLKLGSGVDWAAATDKVSTLRQSTGLGVAGSDGAALVMAVNGLPQPRITTDRDVIRLGEFALEHHKLLMSWRHQLDALFAELEQNAEVTEDALESYLAEVEDLSDLVRADMQTWNLRPVAMTLAAVGARSAVTAVATGNPGLGAVGALARAAMTHSRRLLIRVQAKRWRRTQPGRAYLLTAAREGLLRVPRV